MSISVSKSIRGYIPSGILNSDAIQEAEDEVKAFGHSGEGKTIIQ
jgi:hypothetical protein